MVSVRQGWNHRITTTVKWAHPLEILSRGSTADAKSPFRKVSMVWGGATWRKEKQKNKRYASIDDGATWRKENKKWQISFDGRWRHLASTNSTSSVRRTRDLHSYVEAAKHLHWKEIRSKVWVYTSSCVLQSTSFLYTRHVYTQHTIVCNRNTFSNHGLACLLVNICKTTEMPY